MRKDEAEVAALEARTREERDRHVVDARTIVCLSFGPIGQKIYDFCDVSMREKAWRSRKRVAQAT